MMTANEIAAKYTWNIIINRWIGAWIDFLILFLFLFLPQTLLDGKIYHNTLGIWILLAFLYFPVCEGYFGWSVGKLVTGLRVVDLELNPPGFLKALIRTLFRIIEVNPFLLGGIPAGLIVNISKYKQRLGDKAADTYVLRIDDILEAIVYKNRFEQEV